MKPEDFYSLRVDQVVYFKGEKKEISGLSKNFHETFIYFDCNYASFTWKYICDDCSLEAPKEKKKYFQWMLYFPEQKRIICSTDLYDENGFSIDGIIHPVWDEIRKKKIESIFWEE